MKTCSAPGCTNPVFNNKYGLCRFHLWLSPEYREKALKKKRESPFKVPKPTAKARSTKKGYNIPPESKKRLKQRKTYKEVCDEIDKEAKANGTYKCFFSGKDIEGSCSHHHLKGRGRFYTDKEWIVLAIEEYHHAYHHWSIEKLVQQDWYEGFLNRLLDKSKVLYRKEIIKQEKAGLI